MKFGLTDPHIQLLERIVAEPLQKAAQAQVWVFGSRARGDHQKYSDVDLLIEAKAKIPKELLAQIRANLDESSLPFKVDLVVLEELAPSFRTRALSERQPLGG